MDDKPILNSLRVLLVGGKEYTARLTAEVLALIGITHPVKIADPHAALAHLASDPADLVFCDVDAARVDSESFATAARRATGRNIPVFLIAAMARKSDVMRARDSGFTDTMIRPLSAATVLRKVTAALKTKRPFVISAGFVGPDRRRFSAVSTGNRTERRRAG